MKKLGKAGVTIIEIIVGMLLFSVIAMSISSILVPVLRTYANANELAEMNTLLDNLANEITSDFASARSITFSGPEENMTATVDSVFTYAVDRGILFKNITPVLPANYYKRKTVTVTYYDASGYGDVAWTASPPSVTSSTSSYIISITLLNGDGNPMISREYAVRPLVIEANQYNSTNP